MTIPDEPLLTVCMPTWNRAGMVDYTLQQLRTLESDGRSFEILVVDNCSTDETPEVVAEHQRTMPYLRYCRNDTEVLTFGGIANGIRNARGRYAIFMGDDDSLIADSLFAYVDRLEREPDLVAIYTDFIAWDDENERELHRYFYLKEGASFAPGNPLGLLNFVFQNIFHPEIGIYRQDAFLRCDYRITRGFLPYVMWMYRLSRTGRVAFEPEPFYREHRVVKRHLARSGTVNTKFRLQYIGDEYRNVLESFALSALQDAGMDCISPEQGLQMRVYIERFMHQKVPLEVERAIQDGNWLQALELKRRFILWHGPGSIDQQRRDALQIGVMAALHAVSEVYGSLSDVSGLCFDGFRTEQIADLFRTHFPQVRLLNGTVPADGHPLVLCKMDEPSQTAPDTLPGYRLYFDRLLDTYRVNRIHVDTEAF